jgi:spore coat protein U-like protein
VATPATAGNPGTASLPVHATVLSICNFDTKSGHIRLTYDKSKGIRSKNSLQRYYYNCSNDTTVFVTVGAGGGGGAPGTSTWTMRDANGDPLYYTLFSQANHDCGYPHKAQPFQIGVPFAVAAGAGGGSAERQFFNICGNTQPNQPNAVVGDSYVDTVTITLSTQ